MSAGNRPHYLNSTHPNYKRWKKSREIAFERGKFVRKILEQYKNLSNLKILDIGSGFGGTIENFLNDNNEIYSVEIDQYKLTNQINHPSIKKFLSDANHLSFNEKFDIIILQDFIEHIENPANYIEYIRQYLKDDGIIYLSTPNKFSLINFISDPHWGFPFVSILSRKIIRKVFIPLFRKNEKHRKDIAELKSLKNLIKIFNQKGLDFQLHSRFAVKTLFENPEQVIWSELHLFILKFIKLLRLKNILISLANDKVGFVNKFLTPNFYFVLKQSPKEKEAEE